MELIREEREWWGPQGPFHPSSDLLALCYRSDGRRPAAAAGGAAGEGKVNTRATTERVAFETSLLLPQIHNNALADAHK